MLQYHEFGSIIELIRRFPDERSCHQYLAGQRWAGYMQCPFQDCNGDEAYVFTDGIRYKCKCCKKIYTAKTGTIFEASKLSLLTWFTAMYLVMNKKGISSVRLANDLAITQKSAWFLLQRIRNAFGHEPEPTKLDGVVEIDETFVGGKNKNRHHNKKRKYSKDVGRNWEDKVPVFGMLQRGGEVRVKVLTKRTFADVGIEVVRNVEMGSTLMTDDWTGYERVSVLYNRLSIDHGRGQYVNGEITTNRIENFWSHFKRGMIGIYIKVSRKHLQKYCDEFAFRFNNRNFTTQRQIETILKRVCCRLKYKDLITQ